MLKRKNSLTKQDLLDALIQLKNRSENDKRDVSNASENFETKINALLQTLTEMIQKLNDTIQGLRNDNERLNTEMMFLKASKDSQMEEIINEIQNRRFRETNLMFAGIPESQSSNIQERVSSDREEVWKVIKALGVEIDQSHLLNVSE